MSYSKTQRDWNIRLAMMAVFAANGITFGAWAGNLPRLRGAAGLNDAELGTVLLALSVGAMSAMPLAGFYAARFGTARACLAASLALVLALPLPAVVPGWPPLVASSMLLGLSLGALDLSMNAHAAEVERRWGAAIMSSFHAVWSLGELAGAASSGLLAHAGAGLAASLTMAGSASGVLGLASLRLGDFGPTRRGNGRRLVLPNRAMLGACAVAALSFAVEGATADWSGVYLRTVLDASEALASSSLATFAAAMVACRLVGDFFVRRLGPARVLRAGGVMAAVGLAGAVVAPTVDLASASFALVGIGVANVVPVVISSGGRSGPAGVAMVATAGYAAIMAAPPIVGFVANALGLRTALLLLVAGAAAISLLAGTTATARATPPASLRGVRI